MKKTILTITLILAWIGFFAQVCTGNFVFETQTEIDQFLIDHPNCISIDGSVYVTTNSSGDYPTNLDAFQNIQSVSGSVFLGIVNGPFSLLGLSSMTSIGDTLGVYDWGGQPALLSLDGLNNLSSVGSLILNLRTTLDFSPLDNLTEADLIFLDVWSGNGLNWIGVENVFPGILELPVGFQFYGGEEVIQFSGFQNLTSAGFIHFASNSVTLYMSTFDAFASLTSCDDLALDMLAVDDFVDGFGQLQTVGDLWLDIFTLGVGYPDLSQLESANYLGVISGGENIQPLHFTSLLSAESIYISGYFPEVHFEALHTTNDLFLGSWDIPVVSTFDLPALDSIHGDCYLMGFVESDLSGLDDLDYIGGLVNISDCPNLSYCAIDPICEKLSIDPASISFQNNALGCNTNEEVLSACAISYVTGMVYGDLNCDGMWNAGDVAFPNSILHNQSDMPIGSAYSNGEYYAALPDNATTTIHAVVPSGFLPGPEYSFTTTTFDEVFSNYDFPLCPNLSFHDVRVYGYGGVPRPGFYHSYFVHVKNEAVSAENVVVSIDLSNMPGVSIFNTNGNINGSVVSWTISDLAFLEWNQFYVQVYVDPSTLLGTIYTPTFSASILGGESDDDPSDNVFSFEQTVIGSYDPNDKSVNRTAIDVSEIPTNDGAWLDYTIRFQNTGTAEAITVRVEDVIADNLDLSTFQQLDASHTFDLSFDENGKVEWLFNNIMLPDSNTNEPESHGFIHFRIKTIAGLGVADVVGNSVAIFFDFNEPIITNTATTIFYECTQIAEITGVADVCEGSDALLNANGNWDDYLWTIDGNVVGTTNELMMDNLSAGQQTIALHVSDTYCSEDADFVLDVNAIPATPVISQSGNTLTASGNGIFQWSMNGDILLDTDNSIDITESNTYSVSVTENECSSEVSSGQFTYTGITENIESQAVIYPNPASSVVNLHLPMTGIWHLEVMGSEGQLLQKTQLTGGVNSIDMKPEWCGLLMFKLMNESTGVEVRRTVIVAK
jgi:uncharacterized repeat protein (TIGR01451 family)